MKNYVHKNAYLQSTHILRKFDLYFYSGRTKNTCFAYFPVVFSILRTFLELLHSLFVNSSTIY